MLRPTVQMFKAFDYFKALNSFQTSTYPLFAIITLSKIVVTWIQTYCKACEANAQTQQKLGEGTEKEFI